MTRLSRQRPLPRSASGIALLLAALAAGPWHTGSVRAATTEQVVVDRNTGLAIFGFDPVSYFTDSRAQIGRPDLEFSHGGAAWRFRNEGNRAAFSDHPDIYMPRYGGHDPVAVASGVARPGNPEFWSVFEAKLFLFYSEDAKLEFDLDPKSAILNAEAHWPYVRDMLAP